jgi:hypothetical protein
MWSIAASTTTHGIGEISVNAFVVIKVGIFCAVLACAIPAPGARPGLP